RRCGDIQQVPPTYSAVKVEGRRMHREARQGRPGEGAPRPGTRPGRRPRPFEGPGGGPHPPRRSGTHARGTARDPRAGRGTGGYMSRLVRTRVGSLDLSQAVKPDEVEPRHLLGIEPALREHPRINVPLQQRSRLVRGQSLRTPPGFVAVEPCFAWCEGEVL